MLSARFAALGMRARTAAPAMLLPVCERVTRERAGLCPKKRRISLSPPRKTPRIAAPASPLPVCELLAVQPPPLCCSRYASGLPASAQGFAPKRPSLPRFSAPAGTVSGFSLIRVQARHKPSKSLLKSPASVPGGLDSRGGRCFHPCARMFTCWCFPFGSSLRYRT